ncbi:hypothetical protein BH160DRAFT_4353 [Burkholderia sp. H160]|nr:hypothetical protein BH160DRAFT_4353 [Burkholderia sp. H160]
MNNAPLSPLTIFGLGTFDAYGTIEVITYGSTCP